SSNPSEKMHRADGMKGPVVMAVEIAIRMFARKGSVNALGPLRGRIHFLCADVFPGRHPQPLPIRPEDGIQRLRHRTDLPSARLGRSFARSLLRYSDEHLDRM